MSISDPVAVARREIFLLPKGFSLDAYRTVLNDPTVIRSYYNTIWYTSVGTTLNLVFTVMAAYPLSKRNFSARGVLMFLFVFTMFFSGGLIPLFVLVVKLGAVCHALGDRDPAADRHVQPDHLPHLLPDPAGRPVRVRPHRRGRRVADRLEDRAAAVQADHRRARPVLRDRPLEQLLPGAALPAGCRPAADPDLPAARAHPGVAGGRAAVRDRRVGAGASWRWCRSSSR